MKALWETMLELISTDGRSWDGFDSEREDIFILPVRIPLKKEMLPDKDVRTHQEYKLIATELVTLWVFH